MPFSSNPSIQKKRQFLDFLYLLKYKGGRREISGIHKIFVGSLNFFCTNLLDAG